MSQESENFTAIHVDAKSIDSPKLVVKLGQVLNPQNITIFALLFVLLQIDSFEVDKVLSLLLEVSFLTRVHFHLLILPMLASKAIAGVLSESTCMRHHLSQVDAKSCEKDEEKGKHDQTV